MMRKPSTLGLLLVGIALVFAAGGNPAAKVGEPAPDFTAKASDGKSYRVSDYRGKFVVLEWHNNGCPYTRKHYDSGNMQKLQKEWIGRRRMVHGHFLGRWQTRLRDARRGECLPDADASRTDGRSPGSYR